MGAVEPPVEPLPPPTPIYVIYSFAVSPDGHWLAYRGGWRDLNAALLLKDLRTGRVRVVSKTATEPQWHPNSRLLKYIDNTRPGRKFYDVESDSNRDVAGYCDTMPIFSAHDQMGPDGNVYFMNSHDETEGSIPGLYRILLDSSFKSGCVAYEKIAERGYIRAFPPTTLNWYLAHYNYWEVPGQTSKNSVLYDGFSIVRNFDWQNQRRIYSFAASVFPGIDTSTMRYNGEGWSSATTFDWYNRAIGPCGELYLHFSFMHKQEVYYEAGLVRHDTSKLWVRGMGGWYRVDTAARTFVQLARTWSPLGISVTADGGKLYYGVHMPDSTIVIWEMDRCGRNKRQVTRPEEDPFTNLLRVNDVAIHHPLSVRVLPNPIEGDRLILAFTATRAGNYQIAIDDLLGQQTAAPQQILVSEAGYHEEVIDVSGLGNGLYVGRIVPPDGGSIMSVTFVVQR
jgi:hypothetical protein